jgi:Zn-dependent protease
MATTVESTVAPKKNLLDLILKIWLDWTITVGRVWGIPIDIHILSIIGVFFWFNVLKDDFDLQRIYVQTIEFLILSCSLGVHELMHAVVAKYYKKKVEGMRFILPNIAVVFVDLHPRRPSRDIWIYLAGPMSNLIIAIIVLIISKYAVHEYTWMTLHIMKFAFDINIAIAVFNMIPLYPLDGGRFFMDLLLILKIPQRYANFISLCMASLCFLGLVCFLLPMREYGSLIIVSLLMTLSVLSLTGVLNLEEQTT